MGAMDVSSPLNSAPPISPAAQRLRRPPSSSDANHPRAVSVPARCAHHVSGRLGLWRRAAARRQPTGTASRQVLQSRVPGRPVRWAL